MRILASVLIGLAGSILIWIVTPFNNFTLNNGFIADSFLPIGALAVMLFVVLLLNPLLGRLKRPLMLRRRELAIIFGIVLVASVVPSQGLLRMLPYTLARTVVEAGNNQVFSRLLAPLNLPGSLFPGATAYGVPNPDVERLFLGLAPGDGIPWGAWLAPLASWGVFTLFSWLMMGAMALIVYAQWRKNENLSFPVVEIQNSFIGEPEPGRLYHEIYRSRAFWGGLLFVAALYSLNMLARYFPDRAPAIPLLFDAASLFTQPPLLYLNTLFMRPQIYFLFIAAGFFMSFRMGFSIWFFTVVYNFYTAFGRHYDPTFSAATVNDHRYGAMLVLCAYILWLGRHSWMVVLQSMFFRLRGDEALRDRLAGWLFVVGLGGSLGWMLWIGVGAWSFYYVFLSFMTTLLIMRFIAETGMPFMRIDTGNRSFLLDLIPASWLSGTAAWFSGIHPLWTSHGSRMNFGTLVLHALGLEPGMKERTKAFFVVGLLAIALLGIVVSGAAHLISAYRYTPTIAGYESIQWGAETIVSAQQQDLVSLDKGNYGKAITHNRPLHLAIGAGITAALQGLCVLLPGWPIHPIGIILAMTWFGQVSWLSVLIGWAIKSLMLRFGGSRLLRAAKPFFIGLIAGEVLAFILWGVVAATLAFSGSDFMKVEFQPK